MKHIFVFTGGGLAPALNPTLYGVIKSAQEKGWRITGGLYGWASLLQNGHYVSLDTTNVEPLKNIGGTFLRSSRTNPLKSPENLDQIKEKIRELKIDAIVAIGGDDTLGAAQKMFEAGIPVIGIPKTIDNDLHGTYYTPGFPSAAHYMSAFTREIKEDAAYALSRIFIIEAMGMKAGWLASASIYGGADVIITPESKVSLRHTIDLINQKYIDNGNYAVLIVAQEANFDEDLVSPVDKQFADQYGHVRKSFLGVALREKIKDELGIDTKALLPGNFLETGNPIPLDRDISILLGNKATELIAEDKHGYMPCILRKKDSTELTVSAAPLSEALSSGKFRALPENYFNKETLLPTQEFLDYMEPILGKLSPKDDDYTKLIKSIL